MPFYTQAPTGPDQTSRPPQPGPRERNPLIPRALPTTGYPHPTNPSLPISVPFPPDSIGLRRRRRFCEGGTGWRRERRRGYLAAAAREAPSAARKAPSAAREDPPPRAPSRSSSESRRHGVRGCSGAAPESSAEEQEGGLSLILHVRIPEKEIHNNAVRYWHNNGHLGSDEATNGGYFLSVQIGGN